jgi:hypothetical protein
MVTGIWIVDRERREPKKPKRLRQKESAGFFESQASLWEGQEAQTHDFPGGDRSNLVRTGARKTQPLTGW